MLWSKSNKIEFLCDPKLKDVIPEPYPAKRLIPDWYKRLESYFNEQNEVTPIPTLKRCPPVLDAFSAGWIIPLAADVHFTVRDNGSGVSWESEFCGGNFNSSIVESHKVKQISTHPKAPTVPLKFINHWAIRTPPGWSCIFTMPFNRPDNKLDLLTGIVETDKYFEFVNFPGFIKPTNGYLKLDRGHPLMQVIPFKRDYDKEAIINSMSEKDMKLLQKTRDRRSTESSYYRNNLWEKKI